MQAKALGIIETIGWIAAVEAADAAVKSAPVDLTGCERIGAGLVSVMVSGDVAAVKAAVEAGQSAAQRLGDIHGVTVIARTAEGLDEIVVRPDPPPSDTKQHTISPVQTAPAAEPEPTAAVMDVAALAKMKVTQLRALARNTPDFPLSKKEIRFAKKQVLVKRLAAIGRQRRE